MSRGPDRDFRIFAWIVALTLMLLIVFAHDARASWQDARLNAIASWLAGRPVRVKCLDAQESRSDKVIALGASAYVAGRVDRRGRWWPSRVTVFKDGICQRLWNALEGDASRWSARSLAWAVLVLTHESGHLRAAPWSGSEAETECWAVQHVQAVGRRLGIEALELLQSLVNEQHRMLPGAYQQPGCIVPSPWKGEP